MKQHTKTYLNFFNIEYDIATGFRDFIPCTIEGDNCQGGTMDIHHIDPKGMGGNPSLSREVIENYIAACRNCHDEAHAGVHSMQRLYDLQAAKMMRHLKKKISKIMETILAKIKEYFKKFGELRHGNTADFFKMNFQNSEFVFWNCLTGEITRLRGTDLFRANIGFSAEIIKKYYDPYTKKVVCTPEELKELHDEIKAEGIKNLKG